MEPYNNQGTVGVGVADQVRVLGEAKDIDKVSNPNGIVVNDGGVDSGLNDEVSRLGSMVVENNRTTFVGLSVDRNVLGKSMKGKKKEKVSEVGGSQDTGDEFNTINLVVDLNAPSVSDGELNSGMGFGDNGTETKVLSDGTDIPFLAGLGCNSSFGMNGVDLNEKQDVLIKEQVKDVEQLKHLDNKIGKVPQTQKEGDYKVSDLVWGKVRSHPWWPGQIFDPSASSDKARKHFKKDSFLIAYFGDQTFAWNDASQIKPFRMHFYQMDKQSNTKAFCHAVDHALDEVSRRVEFGLACSCLSEDPYSKIKSQVTVNAGIREESSRKYGGDNFSSVFSFVPAKLVQYVTALAQDPFGGTEKLEFVTARAQLFAFNRWKGYYQLAAHKVLDGLMENDADVPVLMKKVIEDAVPASECDEQVSSGKFKPIALDSSSQKRIHISADGVCRGKRERCLSDLMSGCCSSGSNGENKFEKADRKMSSSTSGRKRKVVGLTSPQKKLLRVGECIHMVASQLSGSTPIFKNGDSSSQRNVSTSGAKPARAPYGVPPSSSNKSQRVKVPAAYPPPDEILSQLCLAAIDPMNEHSFSISLVNFSSDFRNYCLENFDLKKDKKSTGKLYVEQTVTPNLDTTEASGLKGVEDSYWTDRIIQSNPEEQVLFEPEIATPVSRPKLEYKQETAVVNLESDAEKPADHMDEKCKEYSATALILKFDKMDSIPLETNLNKIFSRCGPLKESETKVLKNNRAKVVFKRRSDAETAFSKAVKFSIFGPSLVSYTLDYSPTPSKPSTPGRKRNNKIATSVKAMQFED